MTECPIVSVVILNLNGKKYLHKCLESIFRSTYKNIEVIVVDNGSIDGSQNFIKMKYPTIKLIENGTNLGFGPGNNVGIKAAKGKYIFLLNNDVTIESDCISNLVQKILNDPSLGIIGCKIYFGGFNKLLQHVGGKIDPSGSGILVGYLEKDNGQYENETDVEWVHGAGFLVAQKVFMDIGLFDPIYFPIYHDEVDFCYRARKKGYRVLYLPTAIIYHFEDITSKKMSKTAFYRIRNTLIFSLKYKTIGEIFLLPFYHMKLIVRGLNSSKYYYASKDSILHIVISYIKAIFWVLIFLPRIFRQRQVTR